MNIRPNQSSFSPGAGVAAILRHAWLRSQGSISLRLVWVCVGVFLAVTILNLLGIASSRATVSFLGLSYSGIVNHFWLHQFATAPLLHVDLWHLVFNMLSLWMLGPDVETRMGRRPYAAFSILCAVSSMAGSLLFNWGTGRIVLGYSGVIFGILVAQAVFFPDRMIIMFWFFPMKMKHAAMVLAAVALYFTITSGSGGIAHSAHLFGAVAAYAFLRRPRWFRSATYGQTRNQPHGLGASGGQQQRRPWL
jgi:membrane associated rhomboid family serine protease